MPARVHIFGASGSGTTTLASALAAKHGHRHLDTDDFFWLPTNPPYREIRPRELRPEMRSRALHEAWPSSLPCATLRLDGDSSVAEHLARIEA